MSKKILIVDDLNSKGQGVAKTKDGKVVFIENAVPGDILSAQIKSKTNRIWQAEKIEFMEKSPARIKPLCPYFNSSLEEDRLGCGGCQIQQLNYNALTQMKEKQLIDKLERLAKVNIKEIKINPIIKAKQVWHYRNHIQLKVRYDKQKSRFVKGFYATKSHQVVEHEICYIAPKVESIIWQQILTFLTQSQFEKEFKSNFRELIIRSGEHTKEILIAFVFDFIPRNLQQDLEILQQEVAQLANNINQKLDANELVSVNLIAHKQQSLVLWGKDHLTEKLLDKQFKIAPLSFFQVNTAQAENLFRFILNYLDSQNQDFNTLYDLYCGTGVIGILLSDYFQQVKGIDIFPDAIKNAKENARLNELKQAKFYLGTVENWIRQQDINKTDVIIVDPPRKGLEKKLITTLNKIKANTLIYVSCNPATLARDLKLLKNNWQPIEIQPLDLFPWTMHVECIALLRRVKG